MLAACTGLAHGGSCASSRRFFCTALHAEKAKTQQATAQQLDNKNNNNNEQMHSPLACSSPANLPAYLPLRRRCYHLLSAALLLIRRRLHRVGLPRPQRPSRGANKPLPKFCRGRQRPEIERRPLPSSLFSSLVCIEDVHDIIVRAWRRLYECRGGDSG